MEVNVLLVDVLEATKLGDCRAKMVERVSGLFRKCFAHINASKKAPPNHTVRVQVTEAKPTPADTDLVVYLLPATFWSVVGFSQTGQRKSNLLGDHWGFTLISPAAPGGTPGAKMEVICKSADGCALGSVVFHEIMHGKTGKANAALHATGGLGAATVDCTSELNAKNLADMASAMTRPVTQWTGGWDILMDAKRQRDAGDPFWDQF